MLEGNLVAKLVEHVPQHFVDDHDLVARVAGDVGQVVGMQPQVERVQHGAAAGNRHVGFEMLVMVPAKRGHAIAVFDAQFLQGHGQPLGPLDHVAIGVAMDRFVGQPGDDLAIVVQLLRAAEHRGNRQLEVHDQAVHGQLFFESAEWSS